MAIIAIALVGFANPAAGKGLESVTITGPGIDGSIELTATADDDQLIRLMEQSGVWYGSGDLPTPLDEKPTTELGRSYTLTWVNFGPPGTPVTERTIRQLIYLDAENGPVIHTQEVPKGCPSHTYGWTLASPNRRHRVHSGNQHLGVSGSFRSQFAAWMENQNPAPQLPLAGTQVR